MLNASLGEVRPYPVFARFGGGDNRHKGAHDLPAITPEPLLVQTAARLTAYLDIGLVPSGNLLHHHLAKINGKVETWLARHSQAALGQASIRKDLAADLQSLDQAMANNIINRPEAKIMGFLKQFRDRSVLDS